MMLRRECEADGLLLERKDSWNEVKYFDGFMENFAGAVASGVWGHSRRLRLARPRLVDQQLWLAAQVPAL